MCGRYTLTAGGDQIAAHFLTRNRLEFEARYNIAPTQLAPVVVAEGGDPEVRVAAMFRWGLVPHWADDLKIGNRLINARSETVASKPSFRASYRSRRCLVVADGFYEWKTEGGVKQPYYLRVDQGALFAFAGLWERWVSPANGEVVHSYTLLTTEPNERVAEVHNRMPVILHEDDYPRWLDPRTNPGELEELFRPFEAERIDFFRVSRAVGKPINDDPSLIEPLQV